jgi:hypothetical protein
MAFSLWLPKLCHGLSKTLKNSAETPKVSEISENFVEIPNIPEN